MSQCLWRPIAFHLPNATSAGLQYRNVQVVANGSAGAHQGALPVSLTVSRPTGNRWGGRFGTPKTVSLPEVVVPAGARPAS